MILLFLISIVALYFFFRRKAALRYKNGGMGGFNDDGTLEERVPLGAMSLEDGRGSPGMGSPRGKRLRKGKGKARGESGGGGRYTPPLSGGGGHGRADSDAGSVDQVVFALGDEEDEGVSGRGGGR